MRRRIPAALLSACLLLTAACSDEPPAAESPPPSSTVVAEPPALPAASRPVTLETVRAAAPADLPADAPYADAVSYALYHGFLRGDEEGRFRPDDLVDRATVVTVLQRMSGRTADYDGRFSDVSAGDWCASGAAWAAETGVDAGTPEGLFRPADRVTRAELAAMLYRYAGLMGYDTALSGSLEAFDDSALVPDSAEPSLSWAVGAGVFSGLAGFSLCPDFSVSRAQFAQALVCLLACGEAESVACEIAAGCVRTVSSASRAHHGEIQAAVDAAAREYGAVGVQVAVVEGGAVTDTYAGGWATRRQLCTYDAAADALVTAEYGDPMTADHKLRVASLSKVALAMGAMCLREEGVIDLDEDLGTYWGCRVQNPDYPDAPITLRAILSHTSSIILAGDGVSREYAQVRSRLSGGAGFSRVQPGSIRSWGYNNYAFAVLGMTLEQAAGQVMDDVMTQRIFRSLDIDAAFETGSIRNTDLLATLYNHSGGVERSVSAQKSLGLASATPGATGRFFAGGFTISAADLAKLVAVLAGDGVCEGLWVLSAESVDILEAPLGTPSAPEESCPFVQCHPLRYQEDIYGRAGLFYHTGSSYGVYNCISYDPDTGDGVVVLTTGASAARDDRGIYAVCGDITRYIYEVLA